VLKRYGKAPCLKCGAPCENADQKCRGCRKEKCRGCGRPYEARHSVSLCGKCGLRARYFERRMGAEVFQ
jgi:hypothetical protein